MKNKEKFTKNIHSEYDGEYTKKRKYLHQKIIEYFLKGVNPDQENEVTDAVLLGGGSNAGKSFLSKMLLDEGGFVFIDSDEIKLHIPEYEEYQQTESSAAAQYVHDESSDISAILLEESIHKNLAIVYDGTMKNTQKYENIINELKRNKYTVTMLIADVSVVKAIERNKVRYEETGRMVPESDLIESHQGIPHSFIALKDLVDEYFIYNTSGEKPILIAKKDQDGEKVLIQQYYEEFLEKAK